MAIPAAWGGYLNPHDQRLDHRRRVLVSEQKIPGVKDAELPPITEKTYAIHIVIALALFAVAMLVVAHLPYAVGAR